MRATGGGYFGKLDNYLEQELEYTDKQFDANEGYKIITFRIDDDWYTKTSADWISVDPSSGEAGIVNIAIYVTENRDNRRREGWIDIILHNGKTYRVNIEQAASGEDIEDDNDGQEEFLSPVPSNEIWYVTQSGNIIEPDFSAIDAVLVSNTYEDNMGVLTFDRAVTSIGERAFELVYDVTHIYLPNGLKSIGVCAFRDCEDLQMIYIPGTVESIGEGAFSTCWKLRHFGGRYAIDEGCAVVVGDTFIGYANMCGRTEYSIPEGIKSIGWYAFDNITTLKKVTIPDSVTEIGDVSFAFCYDLTHIYCKPTVPPTAILDDHVEGWEAFSYNGEFKIYVPMESVDAYRSAEHWSNYALNIVGYDFVSGDVVEPEKPDMSQSVPANEIWYTTIDNAILTLNNFESFNVDVVSNEYVDGKGVIEFDGDVTNIGASSFANCANLSSISFPKSITNIGAYAFSGCENLRDVYISDLAAWCNIDFEIANGSENPLYASGNLYLNGELVTELVIPDGVTAIKPLTFFGCRSIRSIFVPESVVEIGGYAFYYCGNLDKVYISDGVQIIGNYAFQGCVNMHSAYIGNGVQTIGKRSFQECYSLSDLTIGEGVKCIGEQSFALCYSLTHITIPDSVEAIEMNAFIQCENLQSVTFGNGVTFIGDQAFASCFSLQSVTIPDSVQTLGNYVFCYCDSLSSATIGNGVNIIGDAAFGNCENLSSVVLGNSVTTIGNKAFYGCANLLDITIGNSVTTIGEWAFFSCQNLSDVELGCNVKTISNSAFRFCYSLKNINLPSSLTTIGEYAFADNIVERFVIPGGVESIGMGAFYGCFNLAEVVICEGVKSIGNTAFAYCASLKSVDMGSVETIGSGAFFGCGSLEYVEIPSSVTTIEDSVFAACNNLTHVYCEAITPPMAIGTVYDESGNVAWSAFSGGALEALYVPTESVEIYKSADGWSEYAPLIYPAAFE